MPAVLQRPTLILNRNWQPIRVSTVARSLILVWNDHARIVDPADFQTYDWSDWSAMAPDDDEVFIQAVNFRLRVPEVVALTKYDRVPMGKVAFNRRNLFKRDHETCQYCGSQPGLDSLTIDHIMPRSRGGTSTWENCALACIECNKRKADRTPKEAHMKLLPSLAGRSGNRCMQLAILRWRVGRSLLARLTGTSSSSRKASAECGVRNAELRLCVPHFFCAGWR